MAAPINIRRGNEIISIELSLVSKANIYKTNPTVNSFMPRPREEDDHKRLPSPFCLHGFLAPEGAGAWLQAARHPLGAEIPGLYLAYLLPKLQASLWGPARSAPACSQPPRDAAGAQLQAWLPAMLRRRGRWRWSCVPQLAGCPTHQKPGPFQGQHFFQIVEYHYPLEAHNIIVFFAAMQLRRLEVELQQGSLEVGCMLEYFLQDPIGFPAVLAASLPGTGLEVELQHICMELGFMHQCLLQPRSWAGGRLTAFEIWNPGLFQGQQCQPLMRWLTTLCISVLLIFLIMA